MQYEHDDDIPDEENQLLLSSGKHSGTHAAKRPIASHSGSSPPSYYAGYVEHAEAHVRTAFVNKVYSILSLQLLVSLGAICLCMFHESTKHFVQSHPAMLTTASFLSLALVLVMVCIPSTMRSYPTNVMLLGVFTLVESFLLGTISSFYRTESVFQAVLITAVIFVGLTLYTMQSDRDFGRMGPVLFVLLMVLVLGSFLRMIFPLSPVAETLYACFGALLFSAYIVFDTHLIMKRLGPDDVVYAALSLYLDIINLFIFILQLMGRRN